MPNFGAIPTKTVNALENFAKRFDQGVDEFLKHLEVAELWKVLITFPQTLDQKLNKFSIYKFVKGLLINLLKALREFLKLLLFFLAPTFISLYGLEITSSTDNRYYIIIGWCLVVIGLLGGLLFVRLLFVSFKNPARTETSVDKDHSGTVLISIDIIAMGIIVGLVLLTPNHQFQSSPLKYIEDQVNNLIYRKPAVRITNVKNNADETIEFNLRHNATDIDIFATGEYIKNIGEHEIGWVDYGWIENARTNKTEWDMREQVVKPAEGDARKQEVAVRIKLDAGHYKLRYKSDGTYSFNDCDANPDPNDKCWGIRLLFSKW